MDQFLCSDQLTKSGLMILDLRWFMMIHPGWEQLIVLFDYVCYNKDHGWLILDDTGAQIIVEWETSYCFESDARVEHAVTKPSSLPIQLCVKHLHQGHHGI